MEKDFPNQDSACVEQNDDITVLCIKMRDIISIQCWLPIIGNLPLIHIKAQGIDKCGIELSKV